MVEWKRISSYPKSFASLFAILQKLQLRPQLFHLQLRHCGILSTNEYYSAAIMY